MRDTLVKFMSQYHKDKSKNLDELNDKFNFRKSRHSNFHASEDSHNENHLISNFRSTLYDQKKTLKINTSVMGFNSSSQNAQNSNKSQKLMLEAEVDGKLIKDDNNLFKGQTIIGDTHTPKGFPERRFNSVMNIAHMTSNQIGVVSQKKPQDNIKILRATLEKMKTSETQQKT